MIKVLLLIITHIHDMIKINEIVDRIVLLVDHTDPLTDATLILDTDYVLIQKTTILQDILIHSDILQDQKIPSILDPALTILQETS